MLANEKAFTNYSKYLLYRLCTNNECSFHFISFLSQKEVSSQVFFNALYNFAVPFLSLSERAVSAMVKNMRF